MIYKFYDKEALQKVPLKDLENRFGIASDDYDELIMQKGLDNYLLFFLLTKMNKFDIIKIPAGYDYGCKIYDNTPQAILNALYYDREYHPDEVTFVTVNKETGKFANKYFGEDSVQIIR